MDGSKVGRMAVEWVHLKAGKRELRKVGWKVLTMVAKKEVKKAVWKVLKKVE